MRQNPISKLLNGLINSDYIDSWSVIHALGGAVVAKVGMRFLSQGRVLLAVFLIALAWELFELATEGIMPYGTAKKWLKNSFADIMIALIFAGIAIL